MTDATPGPAQAGIGHNIPPLALNTDVEIRESLSAKHKVTILDRLAELKKAAATFPKVIKDEETSGQVGDLVGQFRALFRACEAARTTENAPFRRMLDAVDGFFNKPRDEAKTLGADLKTRNEAFLTALEEKRRADALKAQRDADAKRDQALKEAAAAEAKRKEAERLRLEQERIAEEARLRAEEENRKAAEAILAREKAQREGDEAAAAAAKKAEDEAREREEEHRVVEEKHEEKADKIAVKESKAAAVVDNAMGAAVAHDRRSGKAGRAARAKPADLTRVRGELGSVTSLKQVWYVAELSKEDVDLEALRPFLTQEDLMAAAGRFVANGGRKLKGATILEGRDAGTHRG